MASNSTAAFDPAAAAVASIELMQAHRGDVNAALLARYVCLAGLIVLVHDNVTTFRAERNLVWPAMATFSKYGFLFNRYLVPFAFLVVFLPLAGFVGLTFSDLNCQFISSIAGTLSVLSMALGNGLVMIRVVDLWDHHNMAARLMIGGFIVSYATTIATFLVSISEMFGSFAFDPVLNMCVANKTSKWLIPAGVAPLVFEILVLAATCWNAVDRPRSANMSLRSTLVGDGLTFFVVLALARGVNLGFVAAQKPSLVMSGTLLTWAFVTLVSNRSLLAFAQAELDEAMRAPSRSGRRSPFGIRPTSEYDDEAKAPTDWESGAVEVGRVEVELSRR